jgi:hypothetical protein
MRLIESAPDLLKELILAREEVVYLRKSIEWHQEVFANYPMDEDTLITTDQIVL